MKSILRRAMQDSDYWVIEMDYVDATGELSHRVVSPIRFVGDDRFLALCLCREAPRQFQLSRCQDVRLVPAADVLMPIPMTKGGPEPLVLDAALSSIHIRELCTIVSANTVGVVRSFCFG